jgi:hypothetical protein
MGKEYTQQSLDRAVWKHHRWMREKRYAAQRLNLSDVQLNGLDLSGRDLRYAICVNTTFNKCNLKGVNLMLGVAAQARFLESNLRGADLSQCMLAEATFWASILSEADFGSANCSGACFDEVLLTGARFDKTILYDAVFRNAHNVPESARVFSRITPETGSFEMWKKCDGDVLVKLLVPADAKRENGCSRLLRVSKAVVLEILGPHGETTVRNMSDPAVEYRLGDVVTPRKGFDPDWENEYSGGIHGYLSRAEAAFAGTYKIDVDE